MNLNIKKNILFLICRYLLRSLFLLTIFSLNETLADNCQNLGELGTSGSCNGKLIVSRENLLDAISNGSYAIDGPDQNGNTISYTFAEGGSGDIYTRNITDFSQLFKGQKNFNQDIGYWNTNIGLEFYKNNYWSGSISYEYERAGYSSHLNSYQFNINWFF